MSLCPSTSSGPSQLIRKMEKYNAIRHDPSEPEDKKEALRTKLFEGDHLWLHL